MRFVTSCRHVKLDLMKTIAPHIKARIVCEGPTARPTPVAEINPFRHGVTLLPDILTTSGGVTGQLLSSGCTAWRNFFWMSQARCRQLQSAVMERSFDEVEATADKRGIATNRTAATRSRSAGWRKERRFKGLFP